MAQYASDGITLNLQCMVQFAQEEVQYVEYLVSHFSIAAGPANIEAIQDFQGPTNVTELRSFLVLVNHLGDFFNHVSTTTETLRYLLRSKMCSIGCQNKNYLPGLLDYPLQC